MSNLCNLAHFRYNYVDIDLIFATLGTFSVSVNAEEKQKPYIQKYYEYYEGPLEKGVKTFYEQPFGKGELSFLFFLSL